MPPLDPQVRAAGGVVLRDREGGDVEVLLVHRPRYDDWSLPKGKLDPGETSEDAALREVEEETGLACSLADELEPVHYEDRKGRPKEVRYWVMELEDPDDDPVFVPNDEVDEIRWLSLEEAKGLLTHAVDRELLAGLSG